MNIIKIKSFFLVCCLLPLGLVMPAYGAAITTPAEAINAAAHQRSLTQAMLRHYILSGLEVRSRKADQSLQEAIGEFEALHSELLAYVENRLVRDQLTLQQQSWQQLKPFYQGTPDRAQLLAIYAGSEQLLAQTEQLLQTLLQTTGSAAGPLLDQAGRQRMLCQRLSSLYGMMAWGFEGQARQRYEAVYSEFAAGLQTLQNSTDNTPLISYSLNDLQRQLQRTQITAAASTETYVPGLIDRSVEKMLKRVDELQAEYLVLARSLDG